MKNFSHHGSENRQPLTEPNPKPKPKPRSASDRVYRLLEAVLPNCRTALDLVESSRRRPLTLREKIVLKYNSPLCLHCNCNREKFDKARGRLREIKRQS